MKVEIVTPETSVFEGEATLIQLPGYDGLFEVLNNHAPMITFLGKGKVKIENDKETIHLNLDGGVVEVLSNKVLVLAEKCTRI
ncbi:MAG: ATP synthase F1 subunit epsilon [Bacteroidales bacterium]|jgi:F-type H+-transporting ATPase subunit epsilon|nr:ATP synthase F1 subunit epsilon [Bacteroidales bacterium]MBR4453689.1 ATP synthase F1 subunit epsilon [Bacteroidales bacterium]MCR5554942.1 ATP synthase F1 subunit epsilon [Bacteroidales bacterium]